MNHFFTILLAASCLTAVGQVGVEFPTCELQTAIDLNDSEFIQDGVIRLFGLSAQVPGISSDYFDTSEGLTLVRAVDEGAAYVFGTIVNVQDENVTFDVEMFFENGMSGAEFDALSSLTGFITMPECDDDVANFAIYTLENGPSRLVGTGSVEGEIYLWHSPLSLNIRFQLGMGANNHNCNLGFGGWFGWEGMLDGALVQGFSGDLVADVVGAGDCVSIEIQGCTNVDACNYDASATQDDGSCLANDECGVCGGDNSSCSGCTHENATNYDSTATIDNGSCLYSQEAYDSGVASTECPGANSNCPGDFTADGYIGVDDILSMLSLFNTSCSE